MTNAPTLIKAAAEKYAERAYKEYGEDSSIALVLVKNFNSIFRSPESLELIALMMRESANKAYDLATECYMSITDQREFDDWLKSFMGGGK
jgi:hypothetical protein